MCNFLGSVLLQQKFEVMDASPSQWTWVWVNSKSWWWTGRLGILQSTGSQRVGLDWATELNLKKEFIGPGVHLRPVHADHARPPLQWTLNSGFSVYGNDNRRIRPPPDRGILEILSRLPITQENTYTNHPSLQTGHKFFCTYWSVTSGLLIIG